MTNNPNTKEIIESLKDPLYVKVTIQYMNEQGIAFGHQLDYNNYLEIAQAYHSERLKIEAQQPIKSLQECQDEVAVLHGKESWLELWKTVYDSSIRIEVYMYEVSELYASQFQSKVVVSDEEIEKEAMKHMNENACFCPDKQSEGLIAASFETGAEWMRDKLNRQ